MIVYARTVLNVNLRYGRRNFPEHHPPVGVIVLTVLVLVISLSGCATRRAVRELEDSLTEVSRLEDELAVMEERAARSRSEQEDAAAQMVELESELAELRAVTEQLAEGIDELGVRVRPAVETIDRIASAVRHRRPEHMSPRPAAPTALYDEPPRPAEPRAPLRYLDSPPEPITRTPVPPPGVSPLREVSARGGQHEPRPAPTYRRTERVLPPRPTESRNIAAERRVISESIERGFRIYDHRRNPWSGDTLYPYIETETGDNHEHALFVAVEVHRSTELPAFDMRVLHLAIGDSIRRFAIEDDAVQRLEDHSHRREIARIPATDSVLAVIESILRGKHATVTIEGSFERKEIRIAASERRALEALLELYQTGVTP